MAVKFKIKSECVGCGMCFSQYPDYFKEGSDGLAAANEGKLLEDKSQAEKIASVCSVGAIVVEATGGNKKQLAMAAIEKLKNFQGCPEPRQSDIKVRKEEYIVDIPSARGEYRYDYSSDSAAERAALNEFTSRMYSQVDSIILKILTQYRVKYLKPYYTKTSEEGSVYAKSNAEASKILQEIQNIIGSGLPADFDKIEVFPDNDTTWKMLNRGELVSDELISVVRSQLDYSADKYDCYWDIDYTERSAGTNWRGEIKYKDMYCYKNLRRAFEELAKDILNCFHYADSDIERQALSAIEWLVKEYNKKLKSILAQKIALAEAAISK